MENTPKRLGYRMPAEWEPHVGCYLAWPSAEHLWQENLKPAQKEFTELCRVIGASEGLEILVSDDHANAQASKALEGLKVRFHLVSYGDIWLRDTAPIFIKDGQNQSAGVRFRFNGWGEKYVLPGDAQVASSIQVQIQSSTLSFESSLVMEGGSLEFDGVGTCLTTKQCLLNKNRNPSFSQKDIEKELENMLGVEKVLWLDEGLINDHTDGHIDTLVRFIEPGLVACPVGSGNDPNAATYEQLANDLSQMTDARGKKIKVVRVPSPGRVENEEGEIMPASYMNFYISNKNVIVPIYQTPWDKMAVESIAKLFPNRVTIGLSAKAILSGGGAFHCITQQIPS